MAQVVEHLPGKHEALRNKPNTILGFKLKRFKLIRKALYHLSHPTSQKEVSLAPSSGGPEPGAAICSVSVEGFGWVASQRREHTREG
jgi:hypothetical protein